MTATAAPPDVLDNVADPRAHCAYCCNQGVVPVALRPNPKIVKLHEGRPVFHATDNVGGDDWREYATEEYGPCPACMRGKAVEHSRWPNGFWKGRPWWLTIVIGCSCKEDAAAPPADLMERIGAWKTRDVEPSSTPGEDPVDDAPSWAEDTEGGSDG